eukprot:15365422-Ditylum_brightwellii.AAC.1
MKPPVIQMYLPQSDKSWVTIGMSSIAVASGCCKLSIEIKAEKGVQRMCSEGCAMGLGEMLEKVPYQISAIVGREIKSKIEERLEPTTSVLVGWPHELLLSTSGEDCQGR